MSSTQSGRTVDSCTSAPTVSSTEPIHVRLLGEGTTVYRPAQGLLQSPGVALLLAHSEYDPDDEDWEFKPGTVVRFEVRALDGRQVQVAVSTAD